MFSEWVASQDWSLSEESKRLVGHATAEGRALLESDFCELRAAMHGMHWRDACEMYAILRQRMIRPYMRYAFIYLWITESPHRKWPREHVLPLARLFLPAYAGPTLTLYRGCTEASRFDASWTDNPITASSFARSLGDGAFVISAAFPPYAIVCDLRPYLKKRSESEVIVDARDVRTHVFQRHVDQRGRRPSRFVFSSLRASFNTQMRDLREQEIAIGKFAARMFHA